MIIELGNVRNFTIVAVEEMIIVMTPWQLASLLVLQKDVKTLPVMLTVVTLDMCMTGMGV
jgi:hypothetical protein